MMGVAMGKQQTGTKLVAQNRKARHEFLIEDTYEAGMVLLGTEVKSLRSAHCSLDEAYARPQGSEVFLYDMHIPPYEQAAIQNHEPTRPRKLLLHGREIERIASQCAQRGYTLIPLRVYFKEGKAKVEIALARRRRQWDKRGKKAAEERRREARSHVGRRAER